MHNFVLSPIDPEKLISSISERVTANILKAVRNEQPTTEPVGSKKLYSIKELANFLQVSTVTAQRYKNDGLPCMQYGRKVCFDTEQVLNWLYNPKKRGTK